MKKILITGSNGLLGQKLVDLYTQAENLGQYSLIATSRGLDRRPQPDGYAYQSLDTSQPEAVFSLLAQLRPEVVIHTAAMTQVDACETEREACWQHNVEAVQYLAEACQAHDIFLLHLSTDFIFDGAAGPYDETATPNPISYYGQSKLAAEQVLQSTPGLRGAIARTVLVYGLSPTLSRSNIILWVKQSLEQGKTIQVVDDQWRTPTLAEDLARGCFLIAEKEAEGIFNLSGPDMLTPYDMALQTADFFGLDKSLIVRTDASQFSQPARRPPKTGFILDKARRELGYSPHSFAEGILVLSQQMRK
ncbi:MAG: NAD(P)-dependent oxidoreductase [Microscillaceae bacterium]|nr:NAD(P)-dependent oxidoreductase [Microscillaceae bacterium]